MKVTFELKDAKLFFDDHLLDRVVFVSRFGKPLELTLEQLCKILDRVAEERRGERAAEGFYEELAKERI